MPLLRFYLSPNLLSAEEKNSLSQKLTEIYTSIGLPAFYVNVAFIEIPSDSFYVAGEPVNDFIRICIEHIAVKFASENHQQRYMKKLDSIIAPLFESKGFRWEYHINETPRELWKIQSIVPPPCQSPAEQKWARENRIHAEAFENSIAIALRDTSWAVSSNSRTSLVIYNIHST